MNSYFGTPERPDRVLGALTLERFLKVFGERERNVGPWTPAADFPSLKGINGHSDPCLIEHAHGLALAKIVFFPPAFALLDDRQ